MKKLISLIVSTLLVCFFIIFATIKITDAHKNAVKSITCIDGDTYAVNQTFYRLSYIDTPEKGQENYKEATDFLCKMITDCLPGKCMTVKENGQDIYGRTLVELITKDGVSVNSQLIIAGLARPFYDNTTEEILRLYSQTHSVNSSGCSHGFVGRLAEENCK